MSERTDRKETSLMEGKTGEINPCENLHEFWHKILIKSRQETRDLIYGQMIFS